MKASHWELDATLNPDTPDIAAVCLDYAKHIRTMAECLRMDMLEKDAFNEGDDYHGCKRCREPKQSQPGIGSLVHFPFAFSSFRRIRMDFTGRLRFAETNTKDLPASISSSSRRSSLGVQFVPRCCTAIGLRFFAFSRRPGNNRWPSL